MTIQQERDIAVAALEFYADPKMNCPGAAARKALADIAAIAAQASPVAQDERAEYEAWYSDNVPEYQNPVTGPAIEANVRIETWEAWKAGRASVAVPAMAVEPVTVAWMTDDGRVSTDSTKQSMANSSKPNFNIPLGRIVPASPEQPKQEGLTDELAAFQHWSGTAVDIRPWAAWHACALLASQPAEKNAGSELKAAREFAEFYQKQVEELTITLNDVVVNRDELLQRFASWIRINIPEHYSDNACARCIPNGEIVEEGFSCVPHEALDILGGINFTCHVTAQPAAQPVGEAVAYVRSDELAKLSDPRIAGRGMMLSKDAAAGRTALYTAPPLAQSITAAIHYPDHWDTAAYPTVEDALAEVYHDYRCTECAPPVAQDQDAEDKLQRLRDGLAKWGWCAEFGALADEVLAKVQK